ncbi:Holliday junction resolvase RuvX [Mycetocola tolaasinivorans]|uniref:Putative pre-16S rRNA nuclease n=1 Tax=Mycetocola tolaasinivorans TaxID=76635 RepID=A0A3L7ACF4_9MICO|nr:Holliday junction resolvase RuvX [Mycetocola tolaasinivorans]RLP77062.1 Holliday junction resolvase RuvX [Mycetocola tolaasinivorans]
MTHEGFRRGVRLGIDVGKARIGVARSDRDGLLATPVETVARAEDGSDIAKIREHIAELEPLEIVVGLPLSLSGDRTPSTEDAVGFAEALARLGTPVRLVDERLSTVTAHAAMRGVGRSQKKSRGVIDQVAAVIILQHALDTERGRGSAPGEPVLVNEGA